MRPSTTAVLLLVVLPVLVAGGRARREHGHPGRNGPLTDREQFMARTAWAYFENNFQPATCLVNAVDRYPSTTMWDAASSLAALQSAFELGIIPEDTYYDRMQCGLDTLGRLELYNDELPNKAYDTRTGAMVDYANKPGAIGYSALDLGRLLIWLRIIGEREPHYRTAIDLLLSRWNFCAVLDDCGTMYGAMSGDKGGVVRLQEGRLGYEEYAAKGYQLWGFDTSAASRAAPMEIDRIYGFDIPFDGRDPRVLGAHTYVVTESYALDGMELNWDRAGDRGRDDMRHTDPGSAAAAAQIYGVQAARTAATGILTARTEHQLDAEPWFVYDTIYSDGYRWNTLTDDGRYLPASAAVSTKAAFGLWALWETPYTNLLLTAMADQFDAGRGFREGVYEHSGAPIQAFTANTNGIILESLLYKVEGKLLRFGAGPTRPWPAAESRVATERCQLRADQRAPCGPAPE